MDQRTWADLGERFSRTDDELASLRARAGERAADLCGFLDRSPTPFHAVAEVVRRLQSAGFRAFSEATAWSVVPGDKGYVVRGDSTIVAFSVGSASPSKAGFRVIGAHTDSPNLRVKPNPDVANRGYQQVGVEVYGGVLLSTWLDRDLSIAGRVQVRTGSGVDARLVDLARPIARVANLAIHLNRGVNTDGLVLNPQKHMAPIVGLGKEPALIGALAASLGVEASAIVGHDLAFYSVEKAAIAGLAEEFVLSARLDNLASCHAATVALAQASGSPEATRVVALYDHEECGSRSHVGAAGTVLADVLERLVDAFPERDAQGFARARAQTLLVSADMAHAVHPNYDDKHEPNHMPVLNRGMVIKSNVNQSYATEGTGAGAFAALCEDVRYVPQRFVVRSDLPCGSTIGPIAAAGLGVRTVDVGAPMLSMHSCREMAGTLDVHLAIETFARFFA